MTGVIWTMQVLNYPLLARVGRGTFADYEAAHNRRFGFIVIPGVVGAVVGTTGLLFARPDAIPLWLPLGEAALLLVIIVSTAALQGRHHARLAAGFDPGIHAALVRSNWIRVAAWTVASVLTLWMCGLGLRS
jgi:hypothetical protein